MFQEAITMFVVAAAAAKTRMMEMRMLFRFIVFIRFRRRMAIIDRHHIEDATNRLPYETSTIRKGMKDEEAVCVVAVAVIVGAC
mmetsp:Transcript_6260/g.15791  ORF Transcript_6260/g.15791 Transcript_6260/m.15791 type:complete len:84 (-) Transcript_6260:701-952(-)